MSGIAEDVSGVTHIPATKQEMSREKKEGRTKRMKRILVRLLRQANTQAEVTLVLFVMVAYFQVLLGVFHLEAHKLLPCQRKTAEIEEDGLIVEAFAAKIRARRLELDLSQAALAKAR